MLVKACMELNICKAMPRNKKDNKIIGSKDLECERTWIGISAIVAVVPIWKKIENPQRRTFNKQSELFSFPPRQNKKTTRAEKINKERRESLSKGVFSL